MLTNNYAQGDLSDKELFRLIQQGNKEAFTIIYERYNKQMYVLSLRYLKDTPMAEDAVQHVFVKFWEFHSSLDVSLSVKNYLYTMTKNYILNQIRNRNNAIQHNYKIYQSEGMDAYEEDLHKAIEEKEKLAYFYEAINRLPEQKKAICLMKLEGKLSNQEIADEMKISINTVKTHYAQALKMLRWYLGKVLLAIFIILSW
ncbi:RNA polymerase sigma-70 factor [Dysgonomonas sp. 511]|uniref:RNA polymerase sigma-70 factor n=1 Tax=Dysgonomonas sp. 511 TaxID=2302930 RepID=UPI0013D47D95|nr:RNA polymerase sigma-70 factor [Dysgonomonas sp. 511]NDV78715.1 RNA polymerase sigma-70 factor [Dysgonomonas sp. 511]